MKSKLSDDIKEIISQSISWAKLEVNYIKLTAAEKLIVLVSSMIIGGLALLLLLPVFIMFLFALADVFKLIMAPSLAYLTVGGIVLLLLVSLYFFKKQLIINPVSRFITKVILDANNKPLE